MNAVRIPQRPSPLSADQTQHLEALVHTLSPLQAMWVRGYLAGLHAVEDAEQQPSEHSMDPVSASPLTILYGSQTGNAESIARKLHDASRARGINVALVDMLDYKVRNLKKEQALLVVVSTQGEGDPPDGAQELHSFLYGNKAPKLEGLSYSVLALGDSSYEHYCKVGKDFDQRLAELGARRVHERVDCDVDYDEAAERWTKEVVEAFGDEVGTGSVHPTVTQLSSLTQQHTRDVESPTRRHPFAARLLSNIILNGRGSEKEVRHIELDTQGSGLEWAPGDSLGVIPQNPPGLVDRLLGSTALEGDEVVTEGDEQLSLRDALTQRYEITTLTRPLLEKYAQLAGSERLRSLLHDDQREALAEYVTGRDLIDLVEEYPIKPVSGGEFVRLLRRMPARQYSIASSHAANPDEVHLTVAAIRYFSHGRSREGLASVYLAERVSEGNAVRVYVDHNNNFRLPEDDVPIIMVGPGTGVAPFRAFMEEREERGARGRNWLFFVAQHFHTDFYYQTDWLRWRAQGLLTRLDVAFSRDQPEKIYVQHRLRERAKDLFAWLEEGAEIYVCGDAARMAPDVHATLVDVIAGEGGMSTEKATEYLSRLQKSKRYHRDVY